MNKAKMLETFQLACQAGVPITIIRTPDQFETLAEIRKLLEPQDQPVINWDCVRGLWAPPKSLGQKALDARVKDDRGQERQLFSVDELKMSPNFVVAMKLALRLPQFATLVVLNAHRQIHSSEPITTAPHVQSVANLRDEFKQNWRRLVLLGPYVSVTQELEQDVVILDHELPDKNELRTIVVEVAEGAQLPNGQRVPQPSAADIDRAVQALSGLSAFAAEQICALTIGENGYDFDMMWERTRVTIENTPGLSVYRGGDTFDDLKGLDSIKARLNSRKTAKIRVDVVVWIDEGADALGSDNGGSKHDVALDQQRTLLMETEANDWKGVIGVGIAGTGKSAIARALGNELGVITIGLDLAAMKDKYVGASEANLRNAIKVIKAIGKNAFLMFTCNSLKGVRPQVQRRFKKGVFFFDLPDNDERAAIWNYYVKKFDLGSQERPNDDGWTGAEIKECCEDAWDTSKTLLESSRFIIPIARSRPEEIEDMRREAHNRFLDASRPGVYQYDADRVQNKPEAPLPTVRRGVSVIPKSVADMKES
jgi:hypothetical protein